MAVYEALKKKGKKLEPEYYTENPAELLAILRQESKAKDELILRLQGELRRKLEFDELTGIYNRNTFCRKVRELLQEQETEEFVLVRMDIEHFKLINDRYGHEEGDYSLHTIAEILAEIVQKEQTGDGVVARIGGDEYACALMTEKKKELLLQELYDAFTVRNEQSDKPYNVTVSIGACALEPGDEHSLADALSLADEQLYEVKKLRKKDEILRHSLQNQ